MNKETKTILKATCSTLAVFYILGSFGTWLSHASDKAGLIVSPMNIASRTEEYNNIMEQTRMLDEGETQFRMNSDTPVSALVEARDRAAQRLRRSKAYRTQVLEDIISRCGGPWRPIVALADDVTCAEYRAMKF